MQGLDLNMESLEISPIDIDEVSLTGFSSDFSYQNGTLKGAKMKFEVKLDLNYSIGLTVKAWGVTIFSISESGDVNLLDFDSGFLAVDNVKVDPGRMNIDIPKLSLKFKGDNLVIPPRDNMGQSITIDHMELNKIKMNDLVIPGTLPALFGGGMIPVQNPLGAQNMNMSDTFIQDFSTVGITLPPFELTNLQITDMKIEKVLSDNFSTRAHAKTNSDTLNLFGIVKLWVSLDVTTTLTVDEMELSNLDGKIKSDSTSMSGMKLMLKIKDIKIKNMEIDKFDAKEIGVGL
jgi:hypothetical protein